MLAGQTDGQSGEELLSRLVRLSTERVLQEALEQEQAAELGRDRYEPRGDAGGYRNGYENGTLKTGEGVLRVKLPQIRGRDEPYRSPLWSHVARTSDVLQQLIIEMYVGGLSQRDIEYSLEQALGQFVLSKSTVSELTESLAEEYETFRTRDLSEEGSPTSLLIRSTSRYGAGGVKPACCVCGRFVRMDAKCCSVSRPPRGRVMRAV